MWLIALILGGVCWVVSARGDEPDDLLQEPAKYPLATEREIADALRPRTPAEALARLMAGNARFAAGKAIHPDAGQPWREGLVAGQHPFVTLLGCSDSRVSPTVIFDQGLGDMFVVSDAGNVVDPEVAGSIEYAVDYLHTPLVMVLGHESCGAITAALAERAHYHAEPADLTALLDDIAPALVDVPTNIGQAEQVARGVEENVRLSVQRLCELPDLAAAIEQGQIEVRGAIYNLETGRVRLLD